MKKSATSIPLIISVCAWLIMQPAWAQGEDVFDRTIELKKSRGTTYALLSEVSDRSGFLFIYDSRLIDNEQKIRIKTGAYTVREAILTIIRNPDIGMRVVGRHILLFQPENKETPPAPPVVADTLPSPPPADTVFTIEGIIRDQYTEELLPYATVGISGHPIGTISNQNGEFRFKVPDSLRHAQLFISYLGYETQEITCTYLANGYHQIQLIPKVIPIQEVVVRVTSPYRILEEMLDHRRSNYALEPVYHTSFYREGVEYRKRLANMTESVMKIYKSPIQSGSDQVKVLKMRTITNRNETDTLVTKFKSGVDACLLLDLVKNLPEFLQLGDNNRYHYVQSDLTVIDNRLAYVISFEQKPYVEEPLFKGDLYVDMENHALLAARFEVNPRFVEKATGQYITRKSRNIQITPQQIAYTVSYKQWDGTYYVNHIRGDLHFKVRKKGRLFFNAPVHIWFEMVNCLTNPSDVNRFARSETISTRSVFADTEYVYDPAFWENFNIIAPEEQLTNAVNKISAKIEETGY